MEKTAYFRRLFEYDDWANREALDALRRAGPPPEPALGRMAHVAGAQVVWLGRIGHPLPGRAGIAVWPRLSLDECAALLADLAPAWTACLDGLDEAAVVRRVAYTNSQGEPFTSRVDDILTHVLMHGAYHRGQIASDLRAAGHTPAYTDFIHAVRQGFVEE